MSADHWENLSCWQRNSMRLAGCALIIALSALGAVGVGYVGTSRGAQGPTMTNRRVFIGADWRNVEGRLTAHFSGDETLQRELDEEMRGGPKVHSLNAGLIYGIEPSEAATHLVNLKGRTVPAYDAGKRLTHAFNYGMGARHMADTFWVELPFAAMTIDKLSAKYDGVVRWRNDLTNEVFGSHLYGCPQCGLEREEFGVCPTCSSYRRAVRLNFIRTLQEPTKVLYSPFGRRRIYLGRRKEGANAVASQLPQGCGASMWNRTALRLNGWDYYRCAPWPAPLDVYTWNPYEETYLALVKPERSAFITTGTYDSFLMECDADAAETVGHWLQSTMEQPWPELGGRRFPAELQIGLNWGKRDGGNPNGLH